MQGFGLDYNVFEGTQIEGCLIEDAWAAPVAPHVHRLPHLPRVARALEIAGVTGPREFDGNAEIVCSDGAPTGELREIPAAAIVQEAIPEADEEERYGWYAEALRRQNAAGITAVHMMEMKFPENFEILRRLEAEENLTVRMIAPFWIKPDTSAEEMRDLLPLRDERGGLWRGGVAKFFIDGVIDTGTAWLEEPDALGAGTEPFWPDPAAYDAAVVLFAGSGFQVVTHAIGDRAVRRALDAYRAAGSSPGIRHRVEHAETLKDEELKRFVPEGVVVSMQPLHMAEGGHDRLVVAAPRPRTQRAGIPHKGCAEGGRHDGVRLGLADRPLRPTPRLAWARLRRAPGDRAADR